ncbi:MAG: cytochrome c3 family protein [Phycisphaerales bacterium]|nr:cytochrome c3 family protein [Phycisphaerales bacterium]
MEPARRAEFVPHGMGDTFAGLLVGPVLLGMALVILFVVPDARVPEANPPMVQRSSLSTAPLRAALTDPPVASLGHRCNECHIIIQPRDGRPEAINYHRNIVLRHGLNNNCYNCHDRENRERLVQHSGATIGYDEQALLCAQCHGRVYRDWTRGAHGKTVGAWNPRDPRYRRFVCTECHDPHAPMLDGIAPLPGPHTLRMGKQTGSAHEGLAEKRNPLFHWSEHGEEAEAHGGETEGGHD